MTVEVVRLKELYDNIQSECVTLRQRYDLRVSFVVVSRDIYYALEFYLYKNYAFDSAVYVDHNYVFDITKKDKFTFAGVVYTWSHNMEDWKFIVV